MAEKNAEAHKRIKTFSGNHKLRNPSKQKVPSECLQLVLSRMIMNLLSAGSELVSIRYRDARSSRKRTLLKGRNFPLGQSFLSLIFKWTTFPVIARRLDNKLNLSAKVRTMYPCIVQNAFLILERKKTSLLPVISGGKNNVVLFHISAGR